MKVIIKNIISLIIIFLNSSTVFAKDNLVTDLSESTVEISSTFSGADILLFGAYDGQKNDDIIVIVSGQKGEVKVDKKEKKFGIWMVTESIKFSNIPKYYYIASNRKIVEITNTNEIKKRKLDFNNFELINSKIDSKSLDKEWYDALKRNMKEKQVWKIEENSIKLNKNTLFRKTLSLPSNVSTGIYNVKILHYRDGNLISQEESKIKIDRTGVSANIYNVAQNYSAIYGIIAVIVALFFGWFTNFIFKRI
tara:strand:- start:119 stop:871 length:753 start_codon:yes stop_codon:yes gene_type:complete